MKQLKYFLTIIALCVFAIACDSDNSENNPNVGEEILSEMEIEGIPSVVACVVKGEKIVWEGYYGYADRASMTPPNSSTNYTLMSISKLFLSIAVMQLWEQNKIDLEADINTYLPFDVRNPKYPDYAITSNMLLNHTSSLAWPEYHDGIPDFSHFFPHEEVPLLIDWLPEYILVEGAQYRPNVWEDFIPGTKEWYSNIGTALLGFIVEQISGEDYRDYCKTHILQVLEMHHSSFWLDDLEITSLATPYSDNNNPMAFYSYRHFPAGNLMSNVNDMSKFMTSIFNNGAFKGNRILQASTFQEMLQIHNQNSGTANLWDHYIGGGIGHRGGGTGFSTMLECFPDSQTGIFIASNKVNGSVYPGGRIYELVRYQASKH